MTEEHYMGYVAIVGSLGVIQCADLAWHWAVNQRWAHNRTSGPKFEVYRLAWGVVGFYSSSCISHLRRAASAS